MRHLFTSVFLFCFLPGIAQETDASLKIPKKDSTVIYDYKVLVSRYINPKPDSALYYIKKIEQLSDSKNYTLGKVESLYLYASYYRRIGVPDSAIATYHKLYDISEAKNYTKGKGLALNGLCRTNYLQGNLEVAIESCKRCLALKSEITDGYFTIVPDTHIAIASAFIRKNELQPAIENLLVVDSIHKKNPLRPDIIAAAFQSLGNIYTDLGDYDEAENYYLKANNEFKKLPENAANFYMQTTNRHLGEVYYHKSKYEEADSLLSTSRVFFSAIKDTRTLAEINTYLGLLNRDLGNYSKSENFFKEALELNRENTFDYEASQSGIELAQLYLSQNKAASAISTLNEVSELNRGNKNSGIDQQLLFLKSQAYAAQNNYELAFETLKKATHIKDSLEAIQSAERIKEIEGIYQTESRDREIALLTSENELAEEQKKNQRNLLLGGLILSSLLGLFFFFQYRNRQKTNKKLKELDAAKSAFFANISHEFRTPLTLIKGPIEDQLQSQDLSNSGRKNLQTAKANTNRLESLVDQLLALSKLEGGHFNLKVQPGAIANFIEAQIASFNFAAAEKNIQVKTSLSRIENTKWFDRDALEKIMFNLIGNAIKYTPEGGTIDIKGNLEATHYHLSVKNSGSFLDEQERIDVFKRFYQTDPQNPGTGIGLALTKELAELHKGSIAANSDASEPFTEFILKIGVAQSLFESHQILTEELQSPEDPSETTSVEIREETITLDENAPILLVVDDTKEIREYVRSIFEASFVVHEAGNGAEGFEKAKQIVPDLVISDVMMPGSSGLDLAGLIKKDELTAHIPLILLTARSQDADKLQGLESGADAYVTKPFSTNFLKATVENLLDNRRLLQQRFTQEVILTPKEIAVSSADELFLERLQKVMDQHLTDPSFTAEIFSREMNVSRMQLHRKLKALTGQSTTEFLRGQRLKLAARLLREGKISISEVGYTVGFNDPSYFGKCFKKEYGCSPSEFS